MTTTKLVTAPTVEPVTLTEAKSFLRVDGTSDDTLITSLIVGARETCEEISRRAFITQTWDYILDDYPIRATVVLPRPRLISVVSVTCYDSDGVAHAHTDYTVDTRSEPGKLTFDSFPSIALAESGGLVIRFTAGYGAAAANVPQRVKDVILNLLAYRYENRETFAIPTYVTQAMLSERAVWS